MERWEAERVEREVDKRIIAENALKASVATVKGLLADLRIARADNARLTAALDRAAEWAEKEIGSCPIFVTDCPQPDYVKVPCPIVRKENRPPTEEEQIACWRLAFEGKGE